MNVSPRRTFATAIVAVCFAAPVVASTGASADPGPKPDASKGQTKQLLKTISGKDAQLARLAGSHRTTRLVDDVEALLLVNIDADRAALAQIRSAAQAAGSTLDPRAARKELRGFRVVNYVLAGNILHKAERMEDDVAADPTASAHLEDAVAAALAITADSPKSAVRDARGHLRLARGEAEAPVV